MVKFKMPFALFCVLLIGHHVQAVINKSTLQIPLTKEEEKHTKVKADDRISNTFSSPSDEYGPPSGAGFNGPVPVYGPPELVGNLGPTPIYPPPPPELPPPVFEPTISYGPSLNIKSQYGPPKQSLVSLSSSSLLGKPIYGPPKLHYGPPKQHFIPPSFPPYKLPKLQYGPPLKFVSVSSQQYIPPPPSTSQHGPPKPGHGPPIPISLETYGPPPPKLAIQFNPLPNDEYGPLPSPAPAPQPQYGPPVGDLYGLPPPAPPPGVPAPPTPPDIKYDGWQPIAGLASSPNQSGLPADTYGPPISAGAKYNHESTSSSGSQLSHASLTVSTNPNAPSDSYGVPIHNPEAQDLKTSVHKSSASSESNGLPPPPLPQYEPLHNNQGPGVVTSTSHTDHQLNVHQQQSGLQYGVPNIEPLSIVKTVGFELLPTTGALNANLQGLSLSGGTSDVSSFNHISSSVNTNSASLHSGLELTSVDGGSHAVALGNGAESHGYQDVGADLSLQELPQLPQQTPSSDYGTPLAIFGKPSGVPSGASLLSPPPLGSYSAPPLSSYSPNGPYPAAQGGRGGSLFSSFGLFGTSFHKQNLHHNRFHSPFRPPPAPLDSLIPPRPREPIKFKEPIPTGLLSNINRYLPPFTKSKLHGPSISLGQQLPNLHAPVSFHHTSGSNNLFSGSFSPSSSLGGFDSLNSPIAAPHVQYGTPLSFTDFNTPAPHLTYGAPNFGPTTSFVSTSSGFGSNLYSGIGNTLTTTYGTPVVNAPLSIGGGQDCNSLHPLLPLNGALHSNGELSANGELPLSSSLPSRGGLHSSGELHLSGGSSSGAEVSSSEELSPGGGLSAHGGAHSNGKLQLAFEHVGNPVGNAESAGPVFINSLPTSSAAGDSFDGNHQNAIFTENSLPLAKPFGSFLGGPPVNTLDLQHNEQQKTNLKDSYGKPVGVTYDSSNEASDSRVHASTAGVSNEFSTHSSSQSLNTYSAATFEHDSGISAEALTASLTAQAFGRGKNLGSNEVDASQFLKTNEGSEALALAQGLTANGADGFEIQGSKGTYTLQIQPADGGLGTENSDGSIRHDQVLSNGLLQDILAAIEQPNNGPVQLQGLPEHQPLKKVFDLPRKNNVIKGHFITVDGQAQNDGLQERTGQASDRSEKVYPKHQPVALFFDTKYAEARKEIRSASKSETQATRKNERSDSKVESS